MNADLEKRLDTIYESMQAAENEFNEATKCLLEALEGIHQRMERIEKWIENLESRAIA